MTPPDRIVALVFRSKTGCRQYVFASVDELRAWTARKPYSSEVIRVLPVFEDRTTGEAFACRAADAADLLYAELGRLGRR